LSWKLNTEKEMESLREEVARLTSLLEHALRSKPEEEKFTGQLEHMLTNPHNLKTNEVSQHATYF